ncbi:MAG: hypothetical protein AAF478_03595 [Pseudomonadota bacterium]
MNAATQQLPDPMPLLSTDWKNVLTPTQQKALVSLIKGDRTYWKVNLFHNSSASFKFSTFDILRMYDLAYLDPQTDGSYIQITGKGRDVAALLTTDPKRNK